MKSKKVKGLKASFNWKGHAVHYEIDSGAPITAKHIQSLLLYTDYTELCSEFSRTFRAAHFGEGLESIKARNSAYFSMSKLLRETVECFGASQSQENGPFYCGVNRLMLVSSFGIRLCSPTSTSKALAVAIRFADTEGIVMRFNNEEDRLRFFDCSGISAFTEESERLFFGGDWRTRVESVMVIDGYKNYERYFRVFYAFDLMLSGGFKRGLKEEITTKDVERLKWFIRTLSGTECGDSDHDEYAVDTFTEYTRNKRDIVINLNLMSYYFPKGIYEEIVHSVVMVSNESGQYQWSEPHNASTNMVRWRRLFALFPSLETLTIYGTDRGGYYLFPFSLTECVSVLRDDIFVHFESIKLVEIKGVHYEGKRSWIHDAFTAFKGASDGMGASAVTVDPVSTQ